MVHQNNNLNRRLERHHRIDGDLQARARPASLVRKDEGASEVVQQIRGLVERHADEVQTLNRRLGIFGSGDGAQRGSGDTPSSGSSSTTGGSSDDPTSDPSSSSSNGGSSGSTGNSDGADSGSDTTTTNNSGGRPGGFPQTTREDRTTSMRDTRTTSTTSSSSPTTTSSTSTRSSTTRSTTTSTPKTSSSVMPSTSVAYVTSSPLPTLNNAAASTSSPSETAASSSSSVGVGPIIGIVAGALAGVAILAVIIGFLFKKFGRKDDSYETDPFDRNSFRRQSAMLPDNFDDDDHMPEMSEAHNVGPFADDHGYMTDAAMGGAGAMMGGGAGYAAAHNDGGPRPPTMFANHMNAPAAQMSMHDAPSVPAIGNIYASGHDPSPQIPPMAFGGSDPYSTAGVGRQRMENNINNPYGYLDRQYSASHSSPQGNEQVMHQDYADLDRNGSQGSNGYQHQQQFRHQNEEQYSNYEHHNTAGRPGTSEGRSGTPDLPNVQQTYAMAGDDTQEMQRHDGVMSPHRNVISPQHMSQEHMSNGNGWSNGGDPHGYRSAQTTSPDQQHKPLQVRNLLPNPSQQQRPISAVSSVVDDDAAYGGVW